MKNTLRQLFQAIEAVVEGIEKLIISSSAKIYYVLRFLYIFSISNLFNFYLNALEPFRL